MRDKQFIVLSRGLLPLLAVTIFTMANCHVVTESRDRAQIRAREDALTAALRYVREAISEYIHDHGMPPHQLDDLLTAGYFASIPVDPITGKADWAVEFIPCDGPCEKIIKDIHSSSTAKSCKNNLYSEW